MIFELVYDPSMPESIPIVLFLRRGIRRFCGLIQIWLRAMLVGAVWLITLPYMTVWVWRFYFWSGESVAFSLNGQSPPSRLIDNKNSTMPGEKSALAIFYVALLKGTLWYIPPEAVEFVEAYGDFASKFLADTFEGQIITCVVVIVFVAVFMLREWIVQNTPAEDGLENDELDILENDAIQNEGMENNGIGLPNIAPIPEQNANRPEQLGNNNDGEFVFQNGMRLPLFQPQLQFENLEPMQQPEIEPIQNQMQDTGELRVENLAPQTEMPGLNQNDIESDWMEDEYHQINNGDTQIESNVEAIDKSPGLLYQDDFEGDKNSGSTQSISTSSVPHPTWDNEQSNDSGGKSIVADVQQPPFYVPYAAAGTRLSISDYMDEINQKDEDESLAQSDFLTGYSKSDELPSSSQKLPSLASNNSNLGQFESKCVDPERDDESKSKSTQNFSSTSKTSSGQYNIGNLGGTRRIRPISKVRRVGAPTSGLLNTQKLGATSTNPSSYDNEETVNGTSSMDLNYHKVSSTKESPSDNNGDYEEASETSDSDEDNEDINLQEKYPREVGTAYSPSRDITNGNVYYADDSAFPLHRIPKNGQNSSVTNLFGNKNHNSEDNPIERENAEQGGGPVDVIDGGDNGQPDPGLDVINVQQQERQEQQADTIWTQIWNWVTNVLNDIPDLNNEAQDNDPQAVNGNQVAMNPPIGPVRREPNAEAPVFPVPVFNEAIDVPVAGPALDLEGVLEAIGMRGSLWMLAQNSALMAVLIALCLFGSVWLPYFVGKAFLLVKPLNLIQLPLTLLRKVTDPFVDLIIDTTLPWLWGFILPILKSLWNLIYPTLSPLVKDTSLMIYIQDITNQSRYIITHSASLLTQITSTSGKITNGTVIDSNVNHVSEFLEGQNLTVLVKIIDRWNGFAYGNTPTDKIVCIFCGYTIIILLCVWYLSRTRNPYGRTVGRAAQKVLRQQGIVLKVAFFVAIELLIFPIICGILLDLSTLPLFPDATPTSRLEFYLESPVTSTFLHWFTGTAFMFHFAVFVSLCREIVRTGVMWFIRDPNDPQFHPIKEILERPVWTQLKKIGASGIMYSAMIVCGLGSVIYFIRYAFNGILPLQWSFTEPISDFPADLLVFHIIIPVTVTLAKPKRLFRTLFENWWHITSHHLRLTSFMFGGRHYDEEGTHVRKTWRAFFLFLKAPIVDNNAIENDDVAFVKDGGFVRAPSYDAVPVEPGKRMLIPVTEDGTLIDPNDASAIDDDQPGYTIVYIPPNFRARIILFLFLMWFCGSLFCCSVTVLPLLTGRFIFQTILCYERPVHDLYTFTVGLYVMWSLGVTLEWLIRKCQAFAEKRDRYADWADIKRKIGQGIIIIAKIAYLFISFGIVIPFLLS
ncbi:36214_t:CDS:2 [Racocetra persica]|uniref:36214_t:CDS:1 n=1 Tax=Racocetra persica TaxID=160502 RepID=A0ACA9LM94_9GLOM|nr:36214_t:CDS:2 [Racocetra persica]